MGMDTDTSTDADVWAEVRGRLNAAADSAGLIDVAVEAHDSPFGRLLIASTGAGLVRIGLPDEDEDEVMDDLAARVSPRVLRAPRQSMAESRRQLDEYFQGRRTGFDLDLDWRLTDGFRREVLTATARIPYGETDSYGSIAAAAGRPAAARAAGTALATNPIPIVIPCHRVLRSGGEVGQYLGGPAMKVGLLELEGAL